MVVILLLRFAAIAVMSPLFSTTGVALAAIGWWLGQVYIKAQLVVKREMSNARAPIIGHFSATVSGISKALFSTMTIMGLNMWVEVTIRAYGAQEAFREGLYTRLNRYTRAARTFGNLNR